MRLVARGIYEAMLTASPLAKREGGE